MNERNHQGKEHQIQIPGAMIMIKGLKADYHARAYQVKQSKCPFDAGFDLYPDRSEPKVDTLANGILFTIGTCLHCVFPPGTVGLIMERSSSVKKLAGARVKPGVIDSGYTGEILVQVIARPETFDETMSAIRYAQNNEHAIAQMLTMPVMIPMFCQWNDKNIPKGRGDNGFGHSDLFMKG